MIELPACELCNRAPYSLSPNRAFINAEEIFWHINDYHPDLDQGQQYTNIKNAFDAWQESFSPIKISSTSIKTKSNITVYFASDNDPNDLPPSPFGNRSTLAYAYFPVRNRSTIWIDKEERWSTNDNSKGISLEVVVMHEILHSMGVSHTSVKEDIMYPTYNPAAKITSDSVAAIKQLYGAIQKRIKDREAVPEVPTPVPSPTTPSELLEVKEILRLLFPAPYSMYHVRMHVLKKVAAKLGVSGSARRKTELVRRVHKEIYND